MSVFHILYIRDLWQFSLASATPTMICRHKVVRNKGNIFHVIAAVSEAILHCYVIATTFVCDYLGI